jgi:hypothetical protein
LFFFGFIFLYYLFISLSMKTTPNTKIVLLLCFLAIITSATAMIPLKLSYAYVWPCIDRSEGKAPIAVSDNNVYVAWWGNKTGNYEVMFKASDDGGQTFGDKINLSNSTNGTSVEADIAASGDNVYVTYADNKTGTADAYIRVSDDNGKTFGPEVKLTNSSSLANKTLAPENASYGENKATPYELKVAAQGDNVYVLATGGEMNYTKYIPDVFIRTSNDGGKTFGEDINLSESKGVVSERTEIEALGDKVYVTWWDKGTDGSDTPLLRISEDNGQTFGDKIVLTANSTTTTEADTPLPS